MTFQKQEDGYDIDGFLLLLFDVPFSPNYKHCLKGDNYFWSRLLL